jgi:hypothetical protein
LISFEFEKVLQGIMGFSTALTSKAGPLKTNSTNSGQDIFGFIPRPPESRRFAAMLTMLVVPVGNNKIINKCQ